MFGTELVDPRVCVALFCEAVKCCTMSQLSRQKLAVSTKTVNLVGIEMPTLATGASLLSRLSGGFEGDKLLTKVRCCWAPTAKIRDCLTE